MSLFYAAFLALLVASLAVGLLLGGKLAITDLGPQVGAEHLRRRRPLAILVAAGILLFAIGLGFVPEVDLTLLIDILFLLLAIFACSAFAILLLRRRGLGSVLLRLPRSRKHSLFTVSGVAFIFFALMTLLLDSWNYIQALGWLSLGVAFSVIGIFTAFEIRESGISVLDDVLPWTRVASHSWEGSDRTVLTLEITRRPGAFRTIQWKVPAERKHLLISILEQRIAS
jgi:amino acid transporter